MTPQTPRALSCLLLALGLALGPAAGASAYTRPTSTPPTPADLLQNAVYSKTMGIYILNLTPYEIVEADRDTVTDQTNRDRNDAKKFIFLPVGLPKSIPALDATWAPDPTNPTCQVWTPTTNNSALHPLSTAVSFNDREGTVSSAYFSLRLKDVPADQCHMDQTGPVDIGFFFSRDGSNRELVAEVLEIVVSTLTVVIDTIGVALDPENPIAWYDEVLAVKELASSSWDAANSDDTGGTKTYFAAYPWPDQGSAADTSSGKPGVITDCSECDEGEASDAVDAGWNEGMAGTFAGNFVVTTHLIRGHNQDNHSARYSYAPWDAPIAYVVIWTNGLYEAARTGSDMSALNKCEAGRRMHSHLGRRDPKRLFALAHLFESLDATRLETYRQAYRSLQRHHQLSDEQKKLLEQLATAFEQGKTRLEGEAAGERPSHERPSHERPSHERPEASHDRHER